MNFDIDNIVVLLLDLKWHLVLVVFWVYTIFATICLFVLIV